MSKPRSHKAQHWVPKCYQKSWCEPVPDGTSKFEPCCWYFPVDGSPPFRRAPKNMFTETDLYTIKAPNGGRDLRLEHGLCGLESEFVGVRRWKLEARSPLSAADRLVLGAFAAAMYHRTPRKRDHEKGQWRHVHEMGELLRRWAATTTPEQLRRASMPPGRSGTPISPELVEAMATEPLQTALWPRIAAHGAMLATMDLAVLTTTRPAFVASDEPCVWWDPGAWSKPFERGPSLEHEGIQVSLPVSPTQCLLFNRAGCNGYGLASEEQVVAVNGQVSAWAAEHLLFCSNHLPQGARLTARPE